MFNEITTQRIWGQLRKTGHIRNTAAHFCPKMSLQVHLAMPTGVFFIFSLLKVEKKVTQKWLSGFGLQQKKQIQQCQHVRTKCFHKHLFFYLSTSPLQPNVNIFSIVWLFKQISDVSTVTYLFCMNCFLVLNKILHTIFYLLEVWGPQMLYQSKNN